MRESIRRNKVVEHIGSKAFWRKICYIIMGRYGLIDDCSGKDLHLSTNPPPLALQSPCCPSQDVLLSAAARTCVALHAVVGNVEKGRRAVGQPDPTFPPKTSLISLTQKANGKALRFPLSCSHYSLTYCTSIHPYAYNF
jgi:hypothetical protein